jgi:arabinogalactan oligomer/maltooligosaccharide transport system permease protein
VISAFSGPPGLVIKVVLLSVSNALAIWAAYVLATRHNWLAVVGLLAVTAAIDAVYLIPRQGVIPFKFLIPGTVLLAAFQLIPILYTIDVAFTNYGTGHMETKSEAIPQIVNASVEQVAGGRTYSLVVGKQGGDYAFILHDPSTGRFYIGTRKALTPAPPGSVTVKDGQISAAKGYTLITDIVALSALLDGPLKTFEVPYGHGAFIKTQDGSTAFVGKPTLRYDPKTGELTSLVTGAIYKDDGKGQFANTLNPTDTLLPGWRTYIGGSNFSQLFRDPQVRSPFLNVLWWTFVFAAGTVFLSFSIGLFLAIALDKRGMRFQRLYRSILIIPWAVPGVLSLLVWAGLLNDSFGTVNRILHINVPWLFDPNMAKVSCVLVSTWLTTPYFFVVSMGALQSIPEELTEAARVDGARPTQIFRRVTLPLLLIAVGPLLIASFAFNFNNFNNIYLLTGGGPTISGTNLAGATDILISYTYKVAFIQGNGNNYGLASAISILVFIITAAVSAIGFSRTAVLEDVA